MSITLDLTPNEEASLSSLARRGGLAPEEMAAQLVRQALELPQDSTRDQVLAKLHQWQKETGTVTAPRVTSHELFKRWAQEDAHMSEEEKQHETELWEAIEKGLNGDRLTIGVA